ncbi:MAG: amidohydrolase [Candidatus Obscuribacterales bacterium]|nr:amidohydrolase [Candidatus Obscuribacterales bacterium]
MSASTKTMLDRARELEKEIIELRRYLHRHPELSFAETETAKLSAEKLKELGFEVKTGIAKTGVLGDLGSGKRMVAIRADMDALPILESNKTPYHSGNQGVMHACGHDAHVSCGLAAAKLLAKMDSLPGKLRMLMQPAEEDTDSEGKSGAMRMVEEGAMDGVAAVIGLHMDASLPAGKVAIMPGPVMAACDGFKLTIQGKGGHGAYPESTVDSVVIAAQVISAIQQIVSRRMSALDPAVITIGSIHSSSSRGNVISDSVELLGTIRSFTEAVRVKLRNELEKACSLVKALGGEFTIEYELGYPPTVNDANVSEVLKQAACDLIGVENVITLPLKTWSEDFSILAQAAPGAFMFLGGEMKDYQRSHHSPDFDIDESGLYLGPAILAETALRLMKSEN